MFYKEPNPISMNKDSSNIITVTTNELTSTYLESYHFVEESIKEVEVTYIDAFDENNIIKIKRNTIEVKFSFCTIRVVLDEYVQNLLNKYGYSNIMEELTCDEFFKKYDKIIVEYLGYDDTKYIAVRYITILDDEVYSIGSIMIKENDIKNIKEE